MINWETEMEVTICRNQHINNAIVFRATRWYKGNEFIFTYAVSTDELPIGLVYDNFVVRANEEFKKSCLTS